MAPNGVWTFASSYEQWLAADYARSVRFWKWICLNFTLEGATLVPEMRKPFDMLVEGLFVRSSRGDKI